VKKEKGKRKKVDCAGLATPLSFVHSHQLLIQSSLTMQNLWITPSFNSQNGPSTASFLQSI